VIGGSDSSGGAGITRDVCVLADWDVDAAIAITAVTVQTDRAVTAIHHMPPELIAEQITSALSSGSIAAIKIGMVGCMSSLQAVLGALPSSVALPVVLDPVLTASSGRALLEDDAIVMLCRQLLPRVTLLTPNIPEAAVLLQGSAAVDEIDMRSQARALLQFGAQAVLLKGGHASGDDAVDVLVTQQGAVESLRAARIAATLRGTGCMLAAAVAARLAIRTPLLQACTEAKQYVNERLQAARSRAAAPAATLE
jgi:hydroxymethylpyrimidine/phosphomethylpyrimidine kinase